MFKIKEICKEKGITLKELAKRLNITYQSLHTIMTGNPKIKTLHKVADALGVEIWELFVKKNYLSCPKCQKSGFKSYLTSKSELILCCKSCGYEISADMKNDVLEKIAYIKGYTVVSMS